MTDLHLTREEINGKFFSGTVCIIFKLYQSQHLFRLASIIVCPYSSEMLDVSLCWYAGLRAGCYCIIRAATGGIEPLCVHLPRNTQFFLHSGGRICVYCRLIVPPTAAWHPRPRDYLERSSSTVTDPRLASTTTVSEQASREINGFILGSWKSLNSLLTG